MRVFVLALDGVFDSGLSVVVDLLTTANQLAASQGHATPPFEVRLIGMRKRIRTGNGFSRSVERAGELRPDDWVFVPALNTKQPARLVEAMARRDVMEALDFLRRWSEGGTRIAAACAGTFLLAESGILDQCEATTTWSLSPLFRQRYPKVKLDESRMIVPAGRVVTAGAAMAHIDLVFWLIRHHSPALAALLARFSLFDQRESQARYIVPDFLAHADPLVERFERWARANLSRRFSLPDAASALLVGPRTLQRRTAAVLGRSPLEFVQDLRVERAQHLVAIGMDIAAVAEEVGYADAATLRTLLRRRLGRGVREIRSLSSPPAPPAPSISRCPR
jgi:transcriptional regulator GlxA family with amidase domain